MNAEEYANRCDNYFFYYLICQSKNRSIALKAGPNGLPEIGCMIDNQEYILYEVYPDGSTKHTIESDKPHQFSLTLYPFSKEKTQMISQLIHFPESSEHFVWYKDGQSGIAFYKDRNGAIYGKHVSISNLKDGYITLDIELNDIILCGDICKCEYNDIPKWKSLDIYFEYKPLKINDKKKSKKNKQKNKSLRNYDFKRGNKEYLSRMKSLKSHVLKTQIKHY